MEAEVSYALLMTLGEWRVGVGVCFFSQSGLYVEGLPTKGEGWGCGERNLQS